MIKTGFYFRNTKSGVYTNLSEKSYPPKLLKCTVTTHKLSQNWTFDLHKNLHEFDLLHRFWLSLGFSRDKPKLSQNLSYSRDFSMDKAKKIHFRIRINLFKDFILTFLQKQLKSLHFIPIMMVQPKVHFFRKFPEIEGRIFSIEGNYFDFLSIFNWGPTLTCFEGALYPRSLIY